MAGTAAPNTRAMEAFFVHPTSTMQQNYQQAELIADNHLEAIADSNDALMIKLAHSVHQSSKSIEPKLRRPSFWPGYTSDEEAASPIDKDDLSAHSESDFSECSSLPEALAGDCDNVEHQCNRAKAVILKQVGKPKLVAIEKPVDISSRPRVVQHPVSPQMKRSTTRLSRLQIDPTPRKIVLSRDNKSNGQPNQKCDSVHEHESGSPASKPLKEGRSTGRQPSVPLVEAAAQINPALFAANQPTHSMRRKTTISQTKSGKKESAALDPQSTPPASPSGTLRRKSRFGLPSVRPNTGRKSSDANPAPQTPYAREPAVNESKPKMVARGANERAPPLTLPPFPGADGDIPIARESTPWPERNSSSLPMHLRRIPLAGRHERTSG